MQSDPRRPQRRHGRVGGQVPAWSVLPVATIVVVLGGLFWASMWMVLRTPTTKTAVAPPEQTEVVASVSVDGDDADRTIDGADRAIDDADASIGDVDEIVENADDSDADAAAMDAELGPELGPEIPDSWAAALADAQAAVLAQSGAVTVASGADPAEPVNPIVEAGLLDIVASSDSPGGSVANANGLLANAGQQPGDGSQQAADKVAEITARAEGITAKSEELTARAEDLTGRIESLTAKIEELETKLSARPAAVPSPVALPRATPTVVTAAARSGRQTGQSTADGRSPWVVQPLPQPGSRVTVGPVILETRARGEAPITEIRLQLDGVALSVAMERRDDTTWRGRATTRVGPGSHTVAVSVIDGQGRVGSYRWQFDAASS